jgi:hypothetical protein
MNIQTKQNNSDLIDNAEASARLAAQELSTINISKQNILSAKKLLRRAIFLLNKVKTK